MSERDLMKLFESYDGEVTMSDFTVSELSELLDKKEDGAALTKRKYFEYYDDIKSQTLKKQDW